VLSWVFYSLTVRTNDIWDVDHVELASQAVAKATVDVVQVLATD
jgi:hypothetical protein